MYWYEEEVKRLEKERFHLKEEPATLFYGSSSIRLWKTLQEDFHMLKPVNLGFGGSTLAACVWFFERTVCRYNPQRIIFYAGDNDLGDGRNPEEVFIFFQQLCVKIKERYGSIPCYFISIKPSIRRLDIIETIRYANNLVENEIIKQDDNWKFINIFKHMTDRSGRPVTEYFDPDGLHLSPHGYALWKEIVNRQLSEDILGEKGTWPE